MLITYDSTYFFTNGGMICVRNTYQFILSFLNALIETYTTGQPSVIEIGNDINTLHFIVGYNECFIVHISKDAMLVEAMGKEPSDIAETIISQGQNYVRYMIGNKYKKHIGILLNEVKRISKETSEIFINYEIQRKTIDSILYAHENDRNYCVIYDELDDLSESYRVITMAGSYVICQTPISIEITPIPINLEQFTKSIYNTLKESENFYIKKQNRKLKKYVAKTKA